MIPQHVAVCDTETTGVDSKTCKVCEVALFNSSFNIEWATLVDPGIPIPPETSAIHHICDVDVEGMSNWDNAKIWMQDIMRQNNITILAAHNAEYDSTVVAIPDSVWLCTYKCALRQWPDAPSHKNEALKYWLQLGDRGRNFNHSAHSALHDCKTTALILEELLKFQTLETLIQWSKEPKHFSKIMFGKHVGKKWEEIDLGYLQWICKQPDMDKDIVACAAREIQRRLGK
jgi:exodeoxyribonuclease X